MVSYYGRESMEQLKAGSLEPIDAGKGKWWNGIDSADIGQLSALARDIDKTVDQTVKHVARGKIRVGKLLLEARAMFDDHAAFGKWRKENTVVQSKQHAHYLMQVAERFGNATALIEGANYSVLQELVTADQSDIEWVEKRVEEGDPPTVAEVREKVKKGTSKKGLIHNHEQTQSPNTPINIVVQMGLTLRIQEVVKREIKGIEGDFIILGMDPDPQCPCHPHVLTAIGRMWSDAAENADERRAVSDSEERVMEEFTNWYTT